MEKKHNIDKYQGYPHYPASDDITQPKNNNGKERVESEKMPPPPFNDTVDQHDDETSIRQGTDADVTAEDMRMLESAEQNMDTQDGRNLMASALDATDADGDPLNEESSLDNFAGDDLDVPGSADDDKDESIGEEDEENNLYSLGGDLHESQEENKGE